MIVRLSILLFFSLVSLQVANDVPTIYTIGDSTASDYPDSSYPRTGWASLLAPYLDDEIVKVDNRALSGRSSKSFYNETGAWNKVIEDISEGDYLIIQFGHNDQKSDEERATEPYTTYQEYLKRYIDEARAKGAFPILATSIHRNSWSGTSINDTHGDYPPAMRALAEEENVPLLDLHQRTKALFEELGKTYTTNKIFLNLESGVSVNYPDGVQDNTHLQEEGALRISQLVIDAISESSETFDELLLLESAISEVGYINIEVNNSEYGSVSGGSFHTFNDSVTLEASPAFGYAIDNWMMDNEEVGQDTELSFYFDNDSISVTANFDVGYRVTASRIPGNGGTVEGTGYFVEGRTVNLVATPNEGWHFDRWELGDQIISSDQEYSFVVSDASVALVAFFTEEVLDIDQDLPSDIYFKDGYLVIKNAESVGEIEILNLNGQLIFHKKEVVATDYALPNLKSGIYVARMRMKNNSYQSEKFIIKR